MTGLGPPGIGPSCHSYLRATTSAVFGISRICARSIEGSKRPRTGQRGGIPFDLN